MLNIITRSRQYNAFIPIINLFTRSITKNIYRAPLSNSLFIKYPSPFYKSAKRLTTATVPPLSKSCPGCGAQFQTTDATKPGYFIQAKQLPFNERKQSKKQIDNNSYETLVASLDPDTQALLLNDSGQEPLSIPLKKTATIAPTEPAKRTICQRCHNILYQGRQEVPDVKFLRESQQYSSLSFLKSKHQPVLIYVMDITNMPWSFHSLNQIIKIQPNSRIIVAANKFDILPSSTYRHEQRIKDFILSYMKKELNMSTNIIESLVLISAKKGWGIKGLVRRIQRTLLPTDDLYVIGSVNAGKSALINQFLSHSYSLNKQQYKTTSSTTAGTTIGMIKIPLHTLGMSHHHPSPIDNNKRIATREHFLIDTPGIIDDSFIPNTSVLKQFKPVTFRIQPGQSFLLDKNVRIDLLASTQPILLTLFTSHTPHITKTEKLENSHEDLEPIMDGLVNIRHGHRSHGVVDFVFMNMGWISLTGSFENASFQIWLPKGLSNSFRLREPSFLPFEYKGQIRKFFGSGKRALK
ncbi:hypothetical protein BJ944DRAFT_82399 [Cunninghamella echinulata]|nr:hypothetical protein BJ944DRAFT_82399 [Cunninghamella echinulata]